MQLIYIHGLDSDENAIKGQWLEEYCAEHHADIQVYRPNLNQPPVEVMQTLGEMIGKDEQTMLVGSSLGGFFTTALVAKYNVPAVLINPSVKPFESLKRFAPEGSDQTSSEWLQTVVHETPGGWNITPQHFADLEAMFNQVPQNADNMMVLLKTGDEVIDYRIANEYYQSITPASTIIVDEGGDHSMHDIHDKFAVMFEFLLAKLAK